MTQTDLDDHEALAAALEATGDYRVIRRLQPRPSAAAALGSHTRMALYVDVETTGLDPKRDEIIELAMVPFWYGLDGEIVAAGDPFQAFNQPSEPIPSHIQALTGITDDMVAGHRIDVTAVTAAAGPAALVVAHNAAFDRRFLEPLADVFTTKAWACSMSQVDWAGEGHEGLKLAYLAQSSGFFYDRHRAVHDCWAAIELLARPLPRSGRIAMSELLGKARVPTWRIWAEHSPFELKDSLKARGYRWNGEVSAAPRSWYVDVEEAELQAELAFLKAEIYQREVDLTVRRIDAHDRFSERC